MDISLLTQNDTADCTIVDPATGLDTDIVITVYGQDSMQYRSELLAAARKESKDDELNERGLEFLAKLTKSWEGVEYEGKPLKLTLENAIFVYSTSGTIRKQVDRFIAETRNFMPPRSTD